MAHNRRTFLKGAGIATAAVSAGPISLSLNQGQGLGVSRAIAVGPGDTFAPGNFALELDGKLAGNVAAVQGGNAVADVVTFTSGSDLITRKSIGTIHYEEVAIMAGLDMDPVLWDWVDHMLAGDPVEMDGAILFMAPDFSVVRRLEFKNAWLTQVSLPALDAASNAPAFIMISFRPEWTGLMPGSAQLSSPSVAKQKPWLTSNFRLRVGDLPYGRVNKIEALVIKQKLSEFREGGNRGIRLVPGRLEFPDLVVTFSASDGDQWQAFFDDFVLKGHNDPGDELRGTLDFLAPDLKLVLASLKFFNLGIFRLAPEEIEPSSTNMERFRADLYCEGNRLFVGGLS